MSTDGTKLAGPKVKDQVKDLFKHFAVETFALFFFCLYFVFQGIFLLSIIYICVCLVSSIGGSSIVAVLINIIILTLGLSCAVSFVVTVNSAKFVSLLENLVPKK